MRGEGSGDNYDRSAYLGVGNRHNQVPRVGCPKTTPKAVRETPTLVHECLRENRARCTIKGTRR